MTDEQQKSTAVSNAKATEVSSANDTEKLQQIRELLKNIEQEIKTCRQILRGELDE